MTRLGSPEWWGSLPVPVNPARHGGSGVTVVIPSIPPRRDDLLRRAVSSVMDQTLAPEALVIEFDFWHQGAAKTRNHGMRKVTTPWVAFLDDDDELLPDHLEQCLHHAQVTGADMVYPWFTVPEGWDPWPEREGQPYDPRLLDTQNTIPVTVLVRTDLIKMVGGFTPHGPPDNPCDDWGAWMRLRQEGAKIEHLNRRTWLWHWHGNNTSGRGDKW